MEIAKDNKSIVRQDIYSYNFSRGHYGSIPVKLFKIWTSGSGADVI